MLQNIRDNSKGIISKILVSLIAFTFVIWGAEALFDFSSDASAPAEVNGEEITIQELLQTSELQRRQILASNPDIDPVTLDQQAIQAAALQQLIAQKILLQYTQNNDLELSDASVDQMILQSKDFQVDGTFDRELFESLLRNFGLTPTTYRQQLKRGNLIGQVQQAVSGSAFTIESDADLVAQLDGQTRNIAVLTLPLAAEMLKVTMDEQEIDAFYQANKQQFKTPEQVSVSYVALNKSDFYDQVTVSEADLEAAYQDSLDQVANRSEIEASHMLFLVNESQDSAQAMALAQTAYQLLQQGQNFADVAKLHSQDDSTAADGGYIGLLAKGEFGEAFDSALFDLQSGAYSSPVETGFGVQIVYAHATDTALQPSFEEQKPSLTLALKQAGAESLFVAASEIMADTAFSSPDLLEVADALAVDIKLSGLFDRRGGTDIADHDRVVSAAFSDDVLLDGNNSTVIELSSDQLLVLRIAEHNQPAEQALEDVKVDITQQLVNQKAAAALDAKANDYLQQLKQGADIQNISTQESLDWQQFDQLVRGSTLVNSLLVQSAFRLPRPQAGPQYGLAASYNGDISLIQLQSVVDADPLDQTSEQRSALIAALARLQGQADVALLEQSLTDQAVIETF
jgi:peptidyl-prolyl cis-trans isomerase D